MGDELLDSGKAAIGRLNRNRLGAFGRSGMTIMLRAGVLLRRHACRVAGDDVVGGVGEVRDHFAADWLVDELLESMLVELIDGEHSW